MAITVDNRLSGPWGTTPTASSLAASGTVGTVGIDAATAAGPAEYSASVTVHGLTSIKVDTGHHRGNTAHLTFDLPSSGPWWLRFYIQLPSTQAAGEGWEEGVWVARVGDHGLVLHETAGGNIGFRLQPAGLAQDPIQGVLDGTALPINQVLRVELHSDGTDTECRVYAGHDTATVRSCTWAGVAPSGTAAELSGYRYTRNRWLRPGDNDADFEPDTPVADMQNALLDLGYELPQWGADGDYGQESVDAVIAFQQDYGYAIVDGEAGPETLAGIRLATWLEVDGTGRPPATYLSHLAVSDSGWVGPAPEQQDLVTSASATVAASGSLDVRAVQGPQQAAGGGARLAGAVSVSRNARTTATGTVSVTSAAAAVFRAASTSAEVLGAGATSTAVSKAATTTAAAQAAGSSASEGSKHATTTADASAFASGQAWAGGARSAIALDYSRGHISAPFEPIDDDQQLVNDVTAKRTDGSEFRVVQETGPLSVDDPPVGVGRYETSLDLNTAHDIQLRDHAGWRLHLGTWDEARYPVVTVDLVRNPGLVENVASRESGDWLQVLNPPPWLPPGPIDLLIEGYTETLNTHRWTVEFNASSGGPWVVGLVNDPDAEEPTGPRDPDRADTEACELTVAVDAGDTTLAVLTTVGPPWIDSVNYPGMFPFDLVLGGEVVRVTAVAGTGAEQTLTVERALNGITKPHPAGAAVSLARPAVVGL